MDKIQEKIDGLRALLIEQNADYQRAVATDAFNEAERIYSLMAVTISQIQLAANNLGNEFHLHKHDEKI